MDLERVRQALTYEGKDSRGCYYYRTKQAVLGLAPGVEFRLVSRGSKWVPEVLS